MKINFKAWRLKKQQLKFINANAAAMSGKSAEKELCLYRALNAKVRYGMKKKNESIEKIRVIGALTRPKEEPRERFP
jgi:hypothetical protein